MDLTKQFTIAKEISFSGKGVHSGKKTKIKLKPAEINTGLRFQKKGKIIPVKLENVQKSSLCTTIGEKEEKIFTVEHLLSALYGLGITNLLIEVNGTEIPIMDGSADDYVEKIWPLLAEQKSYRDYFCPEYPVYLQSGEKFIILLPADHLKITYIIDYQNKNPGFMFHNFEYSPGKYREEIAPARTFGFFKDLSFLRNQGLAQGASLKNTLVIFENGYRQKLRFSDEPVRHKILDLLGDLAFCGFFLKGEIIACKTGHAEHLKLVEMIFKIKNGLSINN